MKKGNKLLFGFFTLLLIFGIQSCEKEALTEQTEKTNSIEHTMIKEVSDGDDEADDGDDSELNTTLKTSDTGTVLIGVNGGEVFVATELLDDLIMIHFAIPAHEAETIRTNLTNSFAAGEYEFFGCPISEITPDTEGERAFIWN